MIEHIQPFISEDLSSNTELWKLKLELGKWKKCFQSDPTNMEAKYIKTTVSRIFNSADMDYLDKQEETFRFLLRVVIKFQKKNAVADRDDLVVVNLALNTLLHQVISQDSTIVPTDKFHDLKWTYTGKTTTSGLNFGVSPFQSQSSAGGGGAVDSQATEY